MVDPIVIVPEETIEELVAPKRKLGRKILIGAAATAAVVGGVILFAKHKDDISETIEETISE
jgi:hypothetical protein